jgi:hypothetical protein
MRTTLLVASAAVALLAGTAAASAQTNVLIQSRDYRESVVGLSPFPSYYRGYRAYGYAPGFRFRHHWRHWHHW